MEQPRPSSAEQATHPLPLLDPGGPWSFYESPHEVGKLVGRVRGFLMPHLTRIGATRVLEVGCGSGQGPVFLREHGFDAWGVDPHFRDDISTIYPFLVRGRGQSLPFDSGSFDACVALEVIEHVGTTDGYLMLAEDYVAQRRAFVGELCRVSRQTVILATPNKRFPVDEHASSRSGALSFRLHSPLERVTLSLRELEEMFRERGYCLQEFLDPTGYYALERVERRLGRVGAAGARMLLRISRQRVMARTWLNPHLFLHFSRGATT